MGLPNKFIDDFRRGRIGLASTLFYFLMLCILIFVLINTGSAFEDLVHFPTADFIVLAILTNLIYRIFKEGTSKMSPYSIVGVSIIFAVIHLPLKVIVVILFERLLLLPEHYTFSQLDSVMLLNWPYILIYSCIYCFIFIVFQGIQNYIQLVLTRREVNILQAETKRLHTENLNTRLNPHFLFNALNNISMIIRSKDSEKASEMIAALSNLLRRMMGKNDVLTTIAQEKNFLQEYIELEMLRYHDKANVTINIPDEYDKVQIPQMLLQPIVENAFKYGLRDNQKLEILITGSQKGEHLDISIFNNGSTFTGWDINNTKQIGLHHTVHRLRHFYKDNFSFKIKEEVSGVRFIISIPYNE